MSVDENLAGISNVLLYGAMTAYVVAMIAFALDLADGQRTAKGEAARRARLEREAAKAGGAVATLPPPAALARGRRRAAAVATSVLGVAFLLHLGSVVTRGFSVDRVPWGNMFEFAVTGCLVVTGVFLAALVHARRNGFAGGRDLRYLGTFVVGPVLLTLGLALRAWYVEAAELVPALDSYWLIIHVAVAFLASALFTIGFSTTVLQLVQDSRETRQREGRRTGVSFMAALPSAQELERTSARLHAVAFVLWTFTIIAGAIWAQKAWSRYWGWDAKEVWSFVIWVAYAAYLHARATRGWDGRRAAYLSMVGFTCLVANFTIVNIYFVGLHSYAGV
ncbi:cytochrome c-type biogenesis protein CcsB [Kineococcus xinjiangensis]|uniref:Cytochrome c-type biogenesis protein CcsB n=1 Tax=Kineococcus xinjiangensis TaxID=512762 RepID=A0A2S6IH52_9ACTN|nr:c-type cytochrome biogenesis protein CcsB [Kineococcus xinjiangensis]PPK93516.1 cytochrome c-type biogenesis protein CcsB [Kineococcus xinjiangensis]